MTQRQITIEDIMGLKPCYSTSKVEQLFNGLPFCTIDQIVDCGVDIDDKVWVLARLLREKAHVVEFAKKCAERAEEYASSFASSSANARHVSRASRYAYAAADAADAAYYAAASNAAYYAAAAYAARRDAAYVDYTDSAYYAYYAEHAAQITHLKELHKAEEK